MIRLASRQNSPVDGFRFEQRETGWKSWLIDPNTLWDFQRLCNAVQRHRMDNPRFKLPTAMLAIQEEVDRVNGERMKTIVGAESYYVEGSPPASFPAPFRNLPQAAVEGVKKINAGRKLISEWRKEGFGIVSPDEAAHRASICASGCPKNGKGDFASWFTVPATAQLKEEIEEFHHMGLSTEFDDKLNVCTGCLCPLKTKIWVPLPLILKHMTAETKAALDPRCWIL